MDWKNFTVEELKLECKEKGITGYSKLRKDELIELLEESKDKELYYYIDPKTYGEIVLKNMSKKKQWTYLEPEQKFQRNLYIILT